VQTGPKWAKRATNSQHASSCSW